MVKVHSIGFFFLNQKMGRGWEFTLVDEGQAADSGREVSQAQHFSCLCTVWLRLVEADNYCSF